MDEELLEKLRLALPPFLSAESKKELLAQLQAHPNNTNYYGSIPGEVEPVQGDAWRGLVRLDFDTAERDRVVGLVISNSCDIAAANDPGPDQKLLFVPVVELDRYVSFLEEVGKTPQQITELLTNIRMQAVHRIVYLPPSQALPSESIVLLDDVYAQPIASIDLHNMERLFTLNNYGWYVLLIKLSIHFTRMQESTNRQPAATT